eukprot:768815-Hanusia_phi.AAC.4
MLRKSSWMTRQSRREEGDEVKEEAGEKVEMPWQEGCKVTWRGRRSGSSRKPHAHLTCFSRTAALLV